MSSLARFVIRLYPAAWRERYSDEFQALLEDSAPSLSAIFDLMKGAIQMHLTVPKFPKLALMLSVAGMLAGWGISFLVTPSYISTATLRLAPVPGSPSVELRPEIAAMEEQVLSRTSLSAVITDPRLDLYRSQRRRQPIEDVIQAVRTKDIRITLDGGTGPATAFSISFTASDPLKAHDTVQVLVTKFQEANLERQRIPASLNRQRTSDQVDQLAARIVVLEKRLGIPPIPPATPDQVAPVYNGLNLDVLDPPSLPVNPAKPSHAVFAFFGFGAGFIAALIVVIFRRPVHPTIPFPAQPA